MNDKEKRRREGPPISLIRKKKRTGAQASREREKKKGGFLVKKANHTLGGGQKGNRPYHLYSGEGGLALSRQRPGAVSDTKKGGGTLRFGVGEKKKEKKKFPQKEGPLESSQKKKKGEGGGISAPE